MKPHSKLLRSLLALVTLLGARTALAQTNVPGLLDASFNPGAAAGPNGSVLAILRQSDGKVIVGGRFTAFGGFTRNGLARLETNGQIDPTFDPGDALGFLTPGFYDSYSSTEGPRALAAQADGKIIAGGRFQSWSNLLLQNLARFHDDGIPDAAFQVWISGGVDASVNTVAVQTDGRILVGGKFVVVNSNFREALVRLQIVLIITTETAAK